ncbi:MAG: sugar ABC transporter permease [Anaerolineae bacterium]|nr:sugar ABC transporter permease [Anaerolineae bacterium]
MAQLTVERTSSAMPSSSKWALTLRRMTRCKECYLLLTPTFVLILLFNYYPALSALYHSFFQWNGANFKRFTGINNFVLMVHDPTIWLSLGNMVKLTLVALAINLTFPLMAGALIFHLRDLRLAYFYRVLFVVPMVVPGMVTLMIWRFIYNPNIGLLNQILKAIGMGALARPWLGDFKLALYAIMFIGFPWVAGISTLIYLAGFQAIPMELLDAAAIDGASAWKRFWNVELPLVMSQVKLIVILTVIGSFQGFATIMVMTNGGPGTSTMVPGLYLYRNAMYYNKMGYACAIGTMLFIITLILTYLNTRYLKSSVEFTGV